MKRILALAVAIVAALTVVAPAEARPSLSNCRVHAAQETANRVYWYTPDPTDVSVIRRTAHTCTAAIAVPVGNAAYLYKIKLDSQWRVLGFAFVTKVGVA
jgi:hypothetical protein